MDFCLPLLFFSVKQEEDKNQTAEEKERPFVIKRVTQFNSTDNKVARARDANDSRRPMLIPKSDYQRLFPTPLPTSTVTLYCLMVGTLMAPEEDLILAWKSAPQEEIVANIPLTE